jgi:hypothetical protein
MAATRISANRCRSPQRLRSRSARRLQSTAYPVGLATIRVGGLSGSSASAAILSEGASCSGAGPVPVIFQKAPYARFFRSGRYATLTKPPGRARNTRYRNWSPWRSPTQCCRWSSRHRPCCRPGRRHAERGLERPQSGWFSLPHYPRDIQPSGCCWASHHLHQS